MLKHMLLIYCWYFLGYFSMYFWGYIFIYEIVTGKSPLSSSIYINNSHTYFIPLKRTTWRFLPEDKRCTYFNVIILYGKIAVSWHEIFAKDETSETNKPTNTLAVNHESKIKSPPPPTTKLIHFWLFKSQTIMEK